MKKRIAKLITPCCQCTQCQAICPTQAVSLRNDAHVIDDQCTGCGLCVNICPQKNIELVEKIIETHESNVTTLKFENDTYLTAHESATLQEKKQFIAEAMERVKLKRKHREQRNECEKD